MSNSNADASRRDVLKGIAIGTASLVLGNALALSEEVQSAEKSLARANPIALGIDPDAIIAFIEAVNKQVGGVHSMMLLRHGKVAAEAWWKPYEAFRPHILFSLSKSFASTGVGFAVTEKLLTVEDKVISFFPDKLPTHVSENLAAMRVKDLLTMSTGHEKEPTRDTPDWVKEFLASPVPRKPGTHFLYNTPATHILAAIVEKVTRTRLLNYLKPRLLDPLAIEGATWDQSPAGIDIGGYGLSVRTEDIAKFGQLYLQLGKWNGKQIIPESWIREATSKQVSNGDPSQPNDWSQGYGYQFWRCRHGFYRGDGAFGQYCIVMEEHDAVLAITSGVGDMGAIMNAAWTHLLPGFKDAALGSTIALNRTLRSQQVPPPSGKPESPIATQVNGKRFKMESNAEGIESLRLTYSEDKCEIETERSSGVEKVAFGLHDWIAGDMTTVHGKQPVSSRGAWISNDKFIIKSCLLGGPFEWSETYDFSGDQLKVTSRAMNVAIWSTRERPPLSGKAG